jgi:DNA repair protein RadA/Sms
MEGKRAIPVEIQALVTSTQSPNPRRVTNGVDPSRVAMLLAVLERRGGIKLSDFDVYVSTVGGVRLTEPAADLAIAIALASTVKDWPIPETLAAYGEISLAGEVRPVSSATHRAAEARRLGYRSIVDSSTGTLRAALGMARATAEPVVVPDF